MSTTADAPASPVQPAPEDAPAKDKDWTDLLTRALPALIGIVVGFLTAQTLPEVETVLGSDFTAPFVFVGIFLAIIGFVVATVFANLALKTRPLPSRALYWVIATVFFSGGVLALAAVLSIRPQPTVRGPTPFDVELTLEGRTEYEVRARDQARQLGADDPVELAAQCAANIPQPVRVIAIGGTVPAPLVVVPTNAIPGELLCPSIRMRVLGNRGVAIPVVALNSGEQ